MKNSSLYPGFILTGHKRGQVVRMGRQQDLRDKLSRELAAHAGQLPAGSATSTGSCNSSLLYHAAIAQKSCCAAVLNTHLRDTRDCRGVLKRQRQDPMGKSQRRPRLQGPACAEASKVLLPLNASADTCRKHRERSWHQGARTGLPSGQQGLYSPCLCGQGRISARQS